MWELICKMRVDICQLLSHILLVNFLPALIKFSSVGEHVLLKQHTTVELMTPVKYSIRPV